MSQLDSRIVEICEKVAQWWQKLSGKDCFWLARIFCILWILTFSEFFFLLCTAYVRAETIADYLVSLFISVVLLTTPLIQITGRVFSFIKKSEERAYRNLKNRTSNYLKLENSMRIRFLRIALIFTVTGFLFVGLFLLNGHSLFLVAMGEIGALHGLIFISIFYFCACDPLPPGRSKFHIYLEFLKDNTQTIFSPEPVFVPSK